MRYLREYNRYEEEQDFLRDIKEKVESHIADLIDRGFVVNCGLNFTSPRLTIRIIAPIALECLWRDVEDYIIPLVKMLYIDYKVIHSSISLWQGRSFFIFEEDDLDKIETLFVGRKEELESIDFKSYNILMDF